MKSASQLREEALIERFAERKAIKAVQGVSFTHSQKLNNCEVFYTVTDKNGEKIAIQGQHIYRDDTWKKYLRQLSVPIELGRLTTNAGEIASDYARWFLSGGHTERYRYLRSKSARQWLRETARFAVLHRIMEYKHETHNFIDGWAESEMAKIKLLKGYSDEMNKAIGHAIKNREDLEELIEKTYTKYLTLVETRKFAPYEDLPGFPAGTPDPLALPEDDEEDEEEDDNE